ncbi:cytoskeleton-associated protein 2 isoform X1 [Gopherus flavomarginatus]|uniref:cytoskeleton-associated protein 2 isoform X1 n=1 Tax=Gopherus flavomarginatus TaxID=286002 RepID=UPI0021CC3342|nr:cytoskeleton-associated protein 2 isoform X1 [Gopherus flavomarginatus]
MNGRLPPQLPATRRAEPAYREQRRQKVEEYLLRKKAISGLLIQEKRTNISNNRTGKAASDKPEDKIKVLKSAKQKMEDKENANRPPWTQSNNTLKKSTASSKDETLKTTTILTNSTVGTNCSPQDFSSAINTSKDEAVEIKTYRVSFSQSFLHKRNIREKQLIVDKQNSDASLPKKHVPGSYCGKVIPSKINSFRKTLENEGAKSSLANKKPVAPATKPAVRPSSTSSNNAVINNIRATNLASAAKPIHATPFQKRPPVRASHSTHSKSIQNKEKQIVTSVSVNNMTVQKKPDRSGPLSLKTALHNAKPPSVPGSKRTEVPLRNVRLGTSAKSVSVTCGTKATQESNAGNRKHVLPKESTEERRIRLAEWKATKGKVIKRPSTVLQIAQPERETSQEIPKEPVESFWVTIVEEDEQRLFSENVNKTLVECLHLTEQGFPGDEVRAMLEKLIQSVPDAKKLAKYWVCRMRLEQLGPIEKIIAVYEEAILAGAQPKDELRHTVADIMKNTENLLKSVEECVKEEVISKEANSSTENVEEVFKELNLNDEEKAEISNEVIKKEETDSSLKSRQETLPKESKKHRIKYKEQTKSENYKTEDTIKDANLEFKTPEKEKEGSYLIKYNLSTTPYLESVKKKMQCEANDSAVKDIKFLTPVRRSRRLQEKLCKLPDMLKDHDPCVSSLEQLGEFGAVNNAFIYRQNSALQEPITHLEEQEK